MKKTYIQPVMTSVAVDMAAVMVSLSQEDPYIGGGTIEEDCVRPQHGSSATLTPWPGVMNRDNQ